MRVRALFELTLSAASSELSRFAAPLFSFYDEQVCGLTARLEGSEPALLRQIRDEALNTRMIAILHAIERHTAALSAQPDRRSEADFLARYRRHVIDQHGKIQPPDFQRRRRIPIADIYVPPTVSQVIDAGHERAEQRGAVQQANEPDLTVWELAGKIDRTVLLGDPGSGKTTAAQVLMHHFASDEACRIPFLVTLRDYVHRISRLGQ